MKAWFFLPLALIATQLEAHRWWYHRGYPSHHYYYNELLAPIPPDPVWIEGDAFWVVDDEAYVVNVNRHPEHTVVALDNGMRFEVQDPKRLLNDRDEATVLARFYHRRYTEHILLIDGQEFVAYRLS